MHHVTMRMPTHARINSTNKDGAVHVKLNIIPKSLELARSVGREEQVVVLLVRPTANGHCRAQHDPQGLEQRRDSIDHHTAVRVAQNVVLEPLDQSVQLHTTNAFVSIGHRPPSFHDKRQERFEIFVARTITGGRHPTRGGPQNQKGAKIEGDA